MLGIVSIFPYVTMSPYVSVSPYISVRSLPVPYFIRAAAHDSLGAFLNSLASRRRRKAKSKKLGFFKNGSRRIRRYFVDLKQNEAPKGPRS